MGMTGYFVLSLNDAGSPKVFVRVVRESFFEFGLQLLASGHPNFFKTIGHSKKSFGVCVIVCGSGCVP